VNSAPSKNNGYRSDHVALLYYSLKHWTGRDLADPGLTPEAMARQVLHAPFVVASHNTDADPILNYGNLAALRLWETSWQEFTRTPSRHTAEPLERAERKRLLKLVAEQGFIDDYQGIRISKSGNRFMIQHATVWNVVDANGRPHGQAVLFRHWEPVFGQS